MGGARLVNHKGHTIVLIDFSYMEAEQCIDIMAEAKSLISMQKEGSVLTLTHVTETGFNLQSVKALKDFMVHNKPYVKKGAVVGLQGLQKIIYEEVTSFTNRDLPAFDYLEEAKDWLVSEEESEKANSDVEADMVSVTEATVSGGSDE